MERKLQERMVGAAVLILALVVLGPILLDGGPGGTDVAEAPGQRGDEVRTHTFRLDRDPPDRPQAADARPVAEEPAPAAATAPPAAAAPAAQAEPPASAEPSSAPASAPKAAAPAKPPAAPVVVAPTPKVAATAPASPPAPAKPAAGAAPPGGGWVVQVGTFGQKDNAERLAAKLKGGGFAAFVSPTSRGSTAMYRVRVGPAGTREAAADTAKRLAAAGHAGQVVQQ